MNKWHKKQVFATGSPPRSMTPPSLGEKGRGEPVHKGKRPARKAPGASDSGWNFCLERMWGFPSSSVSRFHVEMHVRDLPDSHRVAYQGENTNCDFMNCTNLFSLLAWEKSRKFRKRYGDSTLKEKKSALKMRFIGLFHRCFWDKQLCSHWEGRLGHSRYRWGRGPGRCSRPDFGPAQPGCSLQR